MNSTELETATKALANLCCNFPQPGDQEPFILAYLNTLKDEALGDILDAITRFEHGEVAGADIAFRPTGAQLYAEVRLRRQYREILARRGEPKLKLVPLLPPSHFQNRFKA